MADSKKYFWLKLKEDFFENKQVKYLRKLPSGSDLVIVYLKMQLKSLKTEGLLSYDKILPSCAEELAMVLDEDENIVRMTIAALIKVGAIEEIDDGSLYLIAMQDLIGKEGSSAERVRKFRAKQNQALPCNTPVTKCNTEIEIDKEIELNLDIEKDIKIDDFPEPEDVKPTPSKTKKRTVKKQSNLMSQEFYTPIYNAYRDAYYSVMTGEPNCKNYKTQVDNTICVYREKGLSDTDIQSLIIKTIGKAKYDNYIVSKSNFSFAYVIKCIESLNFTPKSSSSPVNINFKTDKHNVVDYHKNAQNMPLEEF